MLNGLRSPEALFGLGLAGLGAFMFAESADIVSPAPWGPALLPRIVGGGIFLLGIATVVERAWVAAGSVEKADNDWRGFAFVLGSLALFGLLVGPFGFPVAAAALFACVARGHGSVRPGRDFALGLVLALAATFVFAYLLGLPLSWGGALEAALRRG